MCIRMGLLTGDSGKGPIVATLLLLPLPHNLNFVWHTWKTYIFRSFSYTRPQRSASSTQPRVPVPLVFSYVDYTAWLRPERNISYLVVVARSLPAPFLQIHYLPHLFHSFKTPHSTISTITRNQNQPVQVLLPFNSHPTDRSMTWQRMRLLFSMWPTAFFFGGIGRYSPCSVVHFLLISLQLTAHVRPSVPPRPHTRGRGGPMEPPATRLFTGNPISIHCVETTVGRHAVVLGGAADHQSTCCARRSHAGSRENGASSFRMEIG